MDVVVKNVAVVVVVVVLDLNDAAFVVAVYLESI